jgi:CheY-like chemotaxis protein
MREIRREGDFTYGPNVPLPTTAASYVDCSGCASSGKSYQSAALGGRNKKRGSSDFDTEVRSVTKGFGNERPMVLVIDGEQHLLQEIKDALTEAEFACRCCTTANEAIVAAETCPPDLIVCDWNLEGENGVETCEQIRRQPGMEAVPLMFLSSAQRPDVVRRSLETGAGFYCLRKPFAPTVLVELIDQSLNLTTSPA